MKKLFWMLPLILVTACRLTLMGPDPTPTPQITLAETTAPTTIPENTETSLPTHTTAPELTTIHELGQEVQWLCGEGDRLVAVLVDPAIEAGIQTSLEGYQADICGEGYSLLKMVEAFPDPPSLRGSLQELYQDPELDLQGALLIGDHPYARQYFTVEFANPDIPPKSEEVLSTQYYSDLDGIFLAEDDYQSPGGHPYSYNVHHGEMDWEIWVGVLPSYRSDVEKTIQAVNRYFAKNHAYRAGEFQLPRTFLQVNEHFQAANEEEYQNYLNLIRSGQYAWTPFSEESTASVYFHAPSQGLTTTDGYRALSRGMADFAVLSAHGSWRAHGPLDLNWLNANPLRTIFLWSNGCAVGNLDYPRNFLTEALYHPDSRVLVAKGTTNDSGGMGTNQEGFFGHNVAVRMDEGKSFGRAILGHVNVPLIEPWASDRELHFATSIILGDPTLKLREEGGPTPTLEETDPSP